LNLATIELAIAAPFVGSFLGVLVTRLPEGRTVVRGRSNCESCGTPLSPLELFPIASFLALRGRCRHCGASISAIHPAIEIAALIVTLWAATVSSGEHLFAGCVFGWTLLALALLDVRSAMVPLVLTIPLAGAGLLAARFAGQPPVMHLLGAAIGFALPASVWLWLRTRYALEVAALLAAIGAWVSWQGLPPVLTIGAALFLAGMFVPADDRAPDIRFVGASLAAAAWIGWLYGPFWSLP